MTQLLTNAARALSALSLRLNSRLFLLSMLATGLMALPTTLDVVGNLVIGQGVPGTIEVVEFLQVILVFGALGLVHDKRGHIYVEMFLDRMPETARRTLRLIFMICSAALFAIMTWRTLQNALGKLSAGEVSFVLYLPVGIFVLFAAVGLATAFLSFVADALTCLADLVRERRFVPLLAAVAATGVLASLPLWIGHMDWTSSKLLLGAAGMGLLLAALLTGMPIGVAMLGVGFVGLLVVYPASLPVFSLMGMGPYSTAATYMYTVVPMFILMGELAMYSGISRDLFTAASVWLGRLPGGLAVASVTGCAGFAAVSGDSMATAVTMASVALPEMQKKHYDGGFACANLAAGGTLGILIPPSTGFIFYSLVTEVSIGRLFLAGIIPGLILAGLFITATMFFALRHPALAPRGESSARGEKFRALTGILPMLLLIALVLGGILFGFFSPNQGGAVGAVGTYLYALIRRRITFADLRAALTSTALVTTKLMLILIGVDILGKFFAATRLPHELAMFITGLGSDRLTVFCGLVAAYIVLGCMMNVIPMILLTLPALYPTIQALGFDPVWFGVVVVILMEMGQITPPVGINVFALSTVATDVPMGSIFRHIVPYFLCMLGMVFLLLAFPGLATWLPSVFL